MSLKTSVLVTLLIIFIQNTSAQRNHDSYNHLGITAGFTQFDLNTSDLVTSQGSGFIAGFTTRGSFYNKFDMIYGINFLSSGVEVKGSNPTNVLDTQNIDYTIQAVQITFQGSYNFIRNHLSIEAGPVLNINGKMQLDTENLEDYILDGYSTLRAGDIQDISKVNFHIATGLTAGLENFRLMAQYQFGITNTLNKLNDQNLENTDFEGTNSMLILAVLFYF
jgi:hypothetical protein